MKQILENWDLGRTFFVILIPMASQIINPLQQQQQVKVLEIVLSLLRKTHQKYPPNKIPSVSPISFDSRCIPFMDFQFHFLCFPESVGTLNNIFP